MYLRRVTCFSHIYLKWTESWEFCLSVKQSINGRTVVWQMFEMGADICSVSNYNSLNIRKTVTHPGKKRKCKKVSSKHNKLGWCFSVIWIVLCLLYKTSWIWEPGRHLHLLPYYTFIFLPYPQCRKRKWDSHSCSFCNSASSLWLYGWIKFVTTGFWRTACDHLKYSFQGLEYMHFYEAP